VAVKNAGASRSPQRPGLASLHKNFFSTGGGKEKILMKVMQQGVARDLDSAGVFDGTT